MSGKRGTTSERSRSVEVEADPDTDMKDRGEEPNSDGETKTAQDPCDTSEEYGKRYTLHLINDLSTYLCSFVENGEELAAGFQRIPNRRVLPDYFEIISEPIAFSTIRVKIQKKLYLCFADFVKDVAQICHNAQVYNRPSAPIFGAAVRLREVFREELKKLVQKGEISAEDANMPDLGELPPAEETSTGSEKVTVEEEEEEDEGENEDDEDEDNNDSSDNDRAFLNKNQGERGSFKPTLPERKERDKRDDDSHRKRGRPLMVPTPIEARTFSLLRSLRKFKDKNGNLLISAFEKLPDKSRFISYYQTVNNPIALDNIKKKAKRKKYANIDDILTDIELMFNNAKLYNEEDTAVYKAAVELQRQARILVEQEKARPDDDFRDEDGKLPLAEAHHNEQMWRIGDWVHIRNPNDLAKPTIAQIFRIWQDRTGHKWINACWYYRPEQTVHRYEKHFFEREVVKTGQYHDHPVEDILDRCFVMSVTRFNKGRPRGLPADKEVYVCESRYNEEKFRFNKIKIWASCVPDEVRDMDYEMDLFDVPKRIKKVPSPIKHLLRDDAKDTDELPRPTWGNSNAPPIIGAVHRCPPEINESPQPEPMPAPPSVPAPVTVDARSMFPKAREGPSDTPIRAPVHASASTLPTSHYANTQTAQGLGSATPTTEATVSQKTPVPLPHASHHTTTVAPHIPIRPIQYQYQHHQPPTNYTPNYAAVASVHPMNNNPLTNAYGNHANLLPTSRAAFTPATGKTPPLKIYSSQRSPEVYTLVDDANGVLQPQVRQFFQVDDSGRILFFSAPPLNRSHKRLAPGSAGLGHSLKYLAGRREWIDERDKKRKHRESCRDNDRCDSPKRFFLAKSSLAEMKATTSEARSAMVTWFRHLERETQAWRRDNGLEDWHNAA